MKKLVAGAFVGIFALTFAAASPAPQDGLKGAKRPGPVKTDDFNDRAKVEPKRGGIVTQAVNVGFRSLDADQDNSALTSEVCNGYIQEALVGSDPETWEMSPALAESWEIEDNLELKDGKTLRGKVKPTADGYEVVSLKNEAVGTAKKEDVKDVRYGTSFTFHLRKGVTFHNGQPFDANDVRWNVTLLKSPKNGMPNIQGYFDKITECTVLDSHTVRITYAEQYWMALNVIGYMYLRPNQAWDPDGVLLKDEAAFFKTFNTHELMMKPIGTGPYQLDDYKKDVEVTIKRFDGWWGAKALKAPLNGQWPDKIRFKIIKDVVAQLKALENGEIDYVTGIPPEQFDDFFGADDKPNEARRKRFARVEIVYPTYGYVGFNLRKEIWKDVKLRQAISLASCDQEKFIKDVLKGRAERVWSPNYKYAPFHNDNLKPVPYDPKKAEELLAEAGWWDSDGDGILDKDGKKLEFELLTREMPPTMPAMQHCLIMQSNLKKLGIKMEIRKLEWTALLDKVDRGDFDVMRLGWALSSPPNTQDNFQIWHSSQIGESGSNHIAYTNKEVDELLVAIRKELDPEKRTKMQHRVQEIIFNDHAYIFLWMPAELRAYNKDWRGVRFWVPRPCHSLNEWHHENPPK